jgi:hypothetical protein
MKRGLYVFLPNYRVPCLEEVVGILPELSIANGFQISSLHSIPLMIQRQQHTRRICPQTAGDVL